MVDQGTYLVDYIFKKEGILLTISKSKAMYKKNKMPRTNFAINKSYEGESIEQKIRTATEQGHPIDEGAPMIFPPDPERGNPSHDIRADKFEIAQESIGEVQKAKAAKGEGSLKAKGDEPGPSTGEGADTGGKKGKG